MKRLLLTLILLCFGFNAFAQQNTTMGSRLKSNPGIWQYVYMFDDGTIGFRPLVPVNTPTTLLSSVNLNAGNAVSNSLDPIPLGAFNKGELLVTWAFAAAADSDSVNIAIFVSKKTSAASGIRYNAAYTPVAGSKSDSTWAYYTVGEQVMRPIPTYYITRNNLNFLAITGPSNSANPVRFPIGIYRLGASSTGISIPLSDITGAFTPGSYLEITAANLHPRKNLTGFQIDYWPGVN
jgi:hypothetical protein